jgi:hypothetical protein
MALGVDAEALDSRDDSLTFETVIAGLEKVTPESPCIDTA